jgi:hypothetical protein
LIDICFKFLGLLWIVDWIRDPGDQHGISLDMRESFFVVITPFEVISDAYAKK